MSRGDWAFNIHMSRAKKLFVFFYIFSFCPYFLLSIIVFVYWSVIIFSVSSCFGTTKVVFFPGVINFLA